MFEIKQNIKISEKYTDVLKIHPLFNGLSEEEISILLECISAAVISRRAGEYILSAGDTTENMGFVLSGSVLVVQDDFWGHRNIMSRILPGDIFAEPFAAVPDSVLNVSAVAAEDSEILLLNVSRLLSECHSSYGFHNRLIRNLVSVLARKTMAFNEKITHISKRTTREKLLSFLSSQAIRKGSLSFDIDFNRQQLADYLCVERAAMCVELSKLQKENMLICHKNHFELKELSEI